MTGSVYDEDDEDDALSETSCHCCGEQLRYGEELVVLYLVHPTKLLGDVRAFVDCLDDEGNFEVDPLPFCMECWESYADTLEGVAEDRLVFIPKSKDDNNARCSFCTKVIPLGHYAGRAVYGEIVLSPRTKEQSFRPAENSYDTACMECLQYLNEELDENIWMDLWTVNE